MNNDAIGYIILENDTTQREVRNLEKIDIGGNLFFLRFTTVLQSLNCNNRNRRNYNKDAMVKALNSEEISELIANNKWHCETGHPITDNINRIATIDGTKTCCMIKKWWIEGDLVMGEVETLADGMLGTALAGKMLQGMNPSFSLRALARLEKKGGISYVTTPPRIITYDEVYLPSHKEAYGRPGVKKVEKSIHTGKEICYENGAIAITAEDIKDDIIKKSENLNIICESFDIEPSSLAISPQGNMLRMKSNNGDTFVFALESSLAMRTMEYMAGRIIR